MAFVSGRKVLQTAAATACLLASLAYRYCVIRVYRATQLASSLDPASLERAIALEPRDAAHQDLFCRYLLFDKQDADAAVPLLKRDGVGSLPVGLLIISCPRVLQKWCERETAGGVGEGSCSRPDNSGYGPGSGQSWLVQGSTPVALRQFSFFIGNNPGAVTQSLAPS